MIFNVGTYKAGSSFAIPTFSGSHAIFGDEKQGYIECYSTGTITFPKAGMVDVFVLGSGLAGQNGSVYSNEKVPVMGGLAGGEGGKGATGKTLTQIKVEGTYSVSVAAECTSSTTANKSTAFGTTVNTTTDNGGSYGIVDSRDSGSVYSGGKGADGTSYPFGANNADGFVDTNSKWYQKKLGAGGGGSGAFVSYNGSRFASGGKGGVFGGGEGSYAEGKPASANTGSGGGGGGVGIHVGDAYTNKGGNGGSGIVIIRWGYAA